MANIVEYVKGVGIFIFASLMFYFLWDNIFLNLINWAGSDLMSTGLTTSLTILKTMAWTSFLLIYIAVCPLYLVYTIISGSRNDVTTDPISLLKGVGIWAVSMPVLTIVLGLVYKLTDSLSAFDVGEGAVTAANFSWIITLLVMIGISVVPFIYIAKGYGIKPQMLEVGGNVQQ